MDALGVTMSYIEVIREQLSFLIAIRAVIPPSL